MRRRSLRCAAGFGRHAASSLPLLGWCAGAVTYSMGVIVPHEAGWMSNKVPTAFQRNDEDVPTLPPVGSGSRRVLLTHHAPIAVTSAGPSALHRRGSGLAGAALRGRLPR